MQGEAHRYSQAMLADDLPALLAIERAHNLLGYPPDVVHRCLAAFDAGESINETLDEILCGDQ